MTMCVQQGSMFQVTFVAGLSGQTDLSVNPCLAHPACPRVHMLSCELRAEVRLTSQLFKRMKAHDTVRDGARIEHTQTSATPWASSPGLTRRRCSETRVHSGSRVSGCSQEAEPRRAGWGGGLEEMCSFVEYEVPACGRDTSQGLPHSFPSLPVCQEGRTPGHLTPGSLLSAAFVPSRLLQPGVLHPW